MPKPKSSSNWELVAIGVWKLLEAALFLAVAIEAHRLMSRNIADSVQIWIGVLRADPENRFIHAAVTRLTGVSPRELHRLSVGSYVYAALRILEGVGLVMRKHWAEWLTVIATGLLIPLEVYEIFHGHHKLAKVVVLLLNIAIVVYLAYRIRGNRKEKLAGHVATPAIP